MAKYVRQGKDLVLVEPDRFEETPPELENTTDDATTTDSDNDDIQENS